MHVIFQLSLTIDHIRLCDFVVGQCVLLYDSKLKLMPDKLRSCWIGPFVITNVLTHGAVEIQSPDTGKVFKVNGHRLKLFYEGLEVSTPIAPTYSIRLQFSCMIRLRQANDIKQQRLAPISALDIAAVIVIALHDVCILPYPRLRPLLFLIFHSSPQAYLILPWNRVAFFRLVFYFLLYFGDFGRERCFRASTFSYGFRECAFGFGNFWLLPLTLQVLRGNFNIYCGLKLGIDILLAIVGISFSNSQFLLEKSIAKRKILIVACILDCGFPISVVVIVCSGDFCPTRSVWDRDRFTSRVNARWYKEKRSNAIVVEKIVSDEIDSAFSIRHAFDILGWALVLNFERNYYPRLDCHIELDLTALTLILGVSDEGPSVEFFKDNVLSDCQYKLIDAIACLHYSPTRNDRTGDMMFYTPNMLIPQWLLVYLYSSNMLPRTRSLNERGAKSLCYPLLLSKGFEFFGVDVTGEDIFVIDTADVLTKANLYRMGYMRVCGIWRNLIR
ncbi:hypothetical protein FNV43_RR24714 [Rhamnella rubrinervis]|uniref:Uncharacterized protein n=1 Tax=Rhamnella rubrinervis TaxID=2594499 RepID=A0A8K0DYM3_9ROSA|nr:hypothetical protein FNV43_RR24714 [Rhamnella rubrinervis]